MEQPSAARPSDIAELEALIGAPLPLDYHEFLLTENGREWWAGDAYVVLHPIARVIDLFAAADEADGQRSKHPGLVYIGGDGGGEGLAYDFRQLHPPLVLVNHLSDGWHEGILQAESLTALFEAVENGGWDLETTYSAG